MNLSILWPAKNDLLIFAAAIKRKREIEDELSTPLTTSKPKSKIENQYETLNNDQLMQLPFEERQKALNIMMSNAKIISDNFFKAIENIHENEVKLDMIKKITQLQILIIKFAAYLNINLEIFENRIIQVPENNPYEKISFSDLINSIEKAFKKTKPLFGFIAHFKDDGDTITVSLK